MKRLVIFLVALLTAFTCVLAGCESTGYNNNLTGFDGEVSSNGGSVVVKGDYAYFINGIADYTDDNTYGTPVVGSLVRVKTSDLAVAASAKSENAARVSAELVIPALFVAEDTTSGFYIYGNNVYYASPSVSRNKAGEVQNTKLDFIKTSLDGSSSTIIKTVTDKATVYRYVSSGDNVYLVLKTVNDDSESVISIYDAVNCKEVYTTEKIESVIFTDGGNGTEIYYTRLAYDKKLEQDEDFNEVHRVKVDGTDEMLLSGEGLISSSENGVGLTGVTYSLAKDTADTLFIKITYVDTSITTVTRYVVVAKSDLTGTTADDDGNYNVATLTANYEKLETVNEGSASAGDIFTDLSWYQSKDSIVYLDSTYGIIKYSYGTTDENANDNRIRIFYDEDLVGYTAKFWDNGYLYLVDGDNMYYRLNVAALLEGNEAEVERITYVASSTDWYLPEVLGNYFFTVYTADPYNSLVYVADMVANAKLTDEEIEELTASEKDNVQAILDTCVSLYSESIEDAIEDYMDETFGTEK